MLSMALRLLLFFIIIGFYSFGQANDVLPVSLTQNDSGASVVLTHGQILNVSLHQTHANGGYIWRVVPGAESMLQQVQEQCIPDSPCPPGMVGMPFDDVYLHFYGHSYGAGFSEDHRTPTMGNKC